MSANITALPTADSFFRQGAGHTINQDFALHGTLPDGSLYVLVGDGCSSSPNSDFGVRALLLAAQSIVGELPVTKNPAETMPAISHYHTQTITYASAAARTVAQPENCLDATLLTARFSEGKFIVTAFGDGVVVLQRRDGGQEVFVISFAANYPHYLRHSLRAASRERFTSLVDNEKNIAHYTRLPDGTWLEPTKTTSTNHVEAWAGTAEDFEFIAILSDGIQTFQEKADGVPRLMQINDVLPHLFAFKLLGKEFLRRRMNGFQREMAILNWSHFDDLGCAMIYTGADPIIPTDVSPSESNPATTPEEPI